MKSCDDGSMDYANRRMRQGAGTIRDETRRFAPFGVRCGLCGVRACRSRSRGIYALTGISGDGLCFIFIDGSLDLGGLHGSCRPAHAFSTRVSSPTTRPVIATGPAIAETTVILMPVGLLSSPACVMCHISLVMCRHLIGAVSVVCVVLVMAAPSEGYL